MITRCQWASSDLMIKYHDLEWGIPCFDDKILFEFIVLESFQAGLSWATILNKRENFKQAFEDFDYNKIAFFTEVNILKLLQNQGIIRHRGKIEAAINNAKKFIEIQQKFGSFSNYIWAFVNGKPIVNSHKLLSDLPAKTPLSEAISKDLKKHGFKFMGAVTVYSFMQAVGIVNDHTIDCFKR